MNDCITAADCMRGGLYGFAMDLLGWVIFGCLGLVFGQWLAWRGHRKRVGKHWFHLAWQPCPVLAEAGVKRDG